MIVGDRYVKRDNNMVYTIRLITVDQDTIPENGKAAPETVVVLKKQMSDVAGGWRAFTETQFHKEFRRDLSVV